MQILAALRAGADRGVMVTAGTGSGKSLGFLPAGAVRDRRVHRRRSRPRGAQPGDLPAQRTAQGPVLGAAAPGPGSAAGPCDRAAGGGRHWFGATPCSARAVTKGELKDWTEVKAAGGVAGWKCPFLDCPYCGGRAVSGPPADATRGRERLVCAVTGLRRDVRRAHPQPDAGPGHADGPPTSC